MNGFYGLVVCVVLASMSCTMMTSTSSVLELWSNYRVTSGATEYQIGLWRACSWQVGTSSKACSSMPDAGGSLCHGYVRTGQAFSIIAPVFYFFVMVLSLWLCVSKKPVYSGLRWAIVLCSVVALAANIITFAMWVAYAEVPYCGQGNSAGFTYPLKGVYGASFHIDVVASFLGVSLPCITSYFAMMAPPKPVKQVSYPLEYLDPSEYAPTGSPFGEAYGEAYY